MKKILLPTDFSNNSKKAIDYAQLLFKEEACTFYLLYAYHDAPSASTTKQDFENDLKLAVAEMKVKTKSDRHRFESIILKDTLVSAINVSFIDNAIDYIFMGTQGYTALQNLFLGSNTVNVIKYVERCPIVVVPGQYEPDTPKEIVLATDFKHQFVPAELRALVDIASLWNSSLTVVHINSDKALTKEQELNKGVLQNLLRKNDHRFLDVEKDSSLSETLFRLEEENQNLGMVALLYTKHGFLGNLLHEPVVKKMTFKTKVPLLVISKLQ